MAEVLRLSTVAFINDTVAKQTSKTTLKQFIMEQHLHDRLTHDEVTYLFARHQLRSA